jgi:dissimilatory sulfite reductase (desulfoviridin) alpha/beta subunit
VGRLSIGLLGGRAAICPALLSDLTTSSIAGKWTIGRGATPFQAMIEAGSDSCDSSRDALADSWLSSSLGRLPRKYSMPPLSSEELKSLKNRAMMAEKSDGLFSVRIGVTGGHLEAGHLKAVAEIAERFADSEIHLTTRQGVEIPHVPYRNLEALRASLEQAGLRLASAGKCVRGITACPGTYCKFGQIDTQLLAHRLHEQFGGRGGLPHKFKIGIAGCRHGCTKPQENDLGIMSLPTGYVVYVGGKMGKSPRLADKLSRTISTEAELISLIEVVLKWYIAKGLEKERLGSAIDRLGIECLVADIQK